MNTALTSRRPKAWSLTLCVLLLLGLSLPVYAASISSLVEELRSSRTRDAAAAKLLKKGPRAIPALYELANSGQPGARIAAETMAKLGPKATPYLLRAIRNSRKWNARWELVYALRFLGQDPRAMKGIKRGLKDESEHVRRMAVSAIAKGNFPVKSVWPIIRKASQSSDDKTRYRAHQALIKYAPTHKPSFKMVLRSAKSIFKNWSAENRMALEAMSTLHNKYPKVIERNLIALVEQGINAKGKSFRSSDAMDQLQKIGWKTLKTRPGIHARLGRWVRYHKSSYVVRTIFQMLGKAGAKDISKLQAAIQSAKAP